MVFVYFLCCVFFSSLCLWAYDFSCFFDLPFLFRFVNSGLLPLNGCIFCWWSKKKKKKTSPHTLREKWCRNSRISENSGLKEGSWCQQRLSNSAIPGCVCLGISGLKPFRTTPTAACNGDKCSQRSRFSPKTMHNRTRKSVRPYLIGKWKQHNNKHLKYTSFLSRGPFRYFKSIFNHFAQFNSLLLLQLLI